MNWPSSDVCRSNVCSPGVWKSICEGMQLDPPAAFMPIASLVWIVRAGVVSAVNGPGGETSRTSGRMASTHRPPVASEWESTAGAPLSVATIDPPFNFNALAGIEKPSESSPSPSTTSYLNRIRSPVTTSSNCASRSVPPMSMVSVGPPVTVISLSRVT